MHELKDASVCLFLGPHRNLTGIFLVLLGLHPNCQAFNHQGMNPDRGLYKIPLGIVREETDFPESLIWMKDYSTEAFDNFVDSLVRLSVENYAVKSCHAFSGYQYVQDIWHQRYGVENLKKDIKCVVHRDYVLHNIIRTGNVDLEYVIEKNDRLRFFMPIRNVVDCATSSYLKRGNNLKAFPKYKDEPDRDLSVGDLIEAILEDIAWFTDLKEMHPDKFFYIAQHDFSQDKLVEFADFLGISADEQWIKDCMDCWKVAARKYPPIEGSVEYTSQKAVKLLKNCPEVLEELYCLEEDRKEFVEGNPGIRFGGK